jgi:hypothetical protein
MNCPSNLTDGIPQNEIILKERYGKLVCTAALPVKKA